MLVHTKGVHWGISSSKGKNRKEQSVLWKLFTFSYQQCMISWYNLRLINTLLRRLSQQSSILFECEYYSLHYSIMHFLFPSLHCTLTRGIVLLQDHHAFSSHCELHSPTSLAACFQPRPQLLDAIVTDVGMKKSSCLITIIYKTKRRLAASYLGLFKP